MNEPARPFFSVVLPVFRAEGTLRRAAGSIQVQSEKSWEAVFVDDGSPDGSAELVQTLATEDPRFRLVPHAENRGTHGARRTGVAAARGEWILFLDPDDELAPGLLARLRDRIQRDPADLIRYDFAYRNPASVDPAERSFHESKRCTGRAASGPGCALPFFFTGRNESLQIWLFAIRAEVCRAAFAATEDSRLVYTEDIYEVFALASSAGSYGEEPFSGYVYDKGTGGITAWRASREADPASWFAGWTDTLRPRLESFAAMARFAKAFRGPAVRAVRRAMAAERRRVLVGTIPWELSCAIAAGVSRPDAIRAARPALSVLSRSDRRRLRAALVLRRALEAMRLLPRPGTAAD